MIDTDFVPFCEVWTATHDVMPFGKVFAQKHMIMFFEDLENYPLDVIKQALTKHRKTAKAAPAVNDIIEIINAAHGSKHIGVEEAWAKVLPMIGNEYDTFIVTNEILEALRIAEPLFLAGDKFSAARTFKEKYAQLIKCESMPVYRVILGFDKAKRVLAVNDALRLNLIGKEEAITLTLGCDTSAVEKPAGFDLRIAELKKSLNRISLEKSPKKLKSQRESRLRKQANASISMLRGVE